MKIPRYWIKGHVEVTDSHLHRHQFSCWGCSSESLGDAEAKGKARASRLADQILKGYRPERYAYGDRPLREEVLEEHRDRQGQPYLAITRNSYGCHILNAANAMFVDVDLPQPTLLDHLRHRLARITGSSQLSPARRHEAAALEKLKSAVVARSRLGVRVYRTRAGLRYLFTNEPADPKSDSALQMMASLGADPLYIRLCRAQDCFRARLTPKPWRCGVASPIDRWPWPSAEAEARFRQWETRYTHSARRFATCRFLGSYGESRIYASISSVVEIHDRLTNSAAEVNLA